MKNPFLLIFPDRIFLALPVVAALVVLAACKEAPPVESSGPLPVNVVLATEREVTEWQEFNGHIEAVESVEIRPRVSGYLTELHFKAGDVVEKGAPLFQIDPSPYQADLDLATAQLEQAEVTRTLAELDFERTKGLESTGALSAQEIDRRAAALQQAEASVRAAKAARDTAALNLGYTEITSPIRGKMSDARLTVGNLVSANSGGPEGVLTTVVSIDPLYVVFDADENAVLRFMEENAQDARKSVREARIPVFIQLSNEEGFPHEGVLDFADNRIDPTTGTKRIRGVFKSWDPMLTPGFFVRVRIAAGEPAPAVLLPDAVISSQQGVRYVYVVKPDGTLERRNIETGPISDGLRIVRSGVENGEQVVSTRLQMLRPGLAVEPLLETAPDASDASDEAAEAAGVSDEAGEPGTSEEAGATEPSGMKD